MEKMLVNDPYTGECEITRVEVGNFEKSGLPVMIQLYDSEGPYATLTKNFGNLAGNSSIVMPLCGWVDTNNYPFAESFIEKYSLGEPVTRFGDPVMEYSGFCVYPYYKFNLEKLRELDPDGTREYIDNWQKAAKKALKKLNG